MTAKTTKRRTALSSALGSKTFERVLIVAAVAAVLVAFGAWYAMARPGDTEAAGAVGRWDPAGEGDLVADPAPDVCCAAAAAALICSSAAIWSISALSSVVVAAGELA